MAIRLANTVISAAVGVLHQQLVAHIMFAGKEYFAKETKIF
jgi:hypothetical protein